MSTIEDYLVCEASDKQWLLSLAEKCTEFYCSFEDLPLYINIKPYLEDDLTCSKKIAQIQKAIIEWRLKIGK